jgi:hypothetical protein
MHGVGPLLFDIAPSWQSARDIPTKFQLLSPRPTLTEKPPARQTASAEMGNRSRQPASNGAAQREGVLASLQRTVHLTQIAQFSGSGLRLPLGS